MIRVQTSAVVHAPAATVRDVYADFAGWPRIFPMISAVRLVRRDDAKALLEVDHVEGKVLNELVRVSEDELVLREWKRRYDAVFVNRFRTVTQGTLFTVTGELRLKGAAKHLGPFLRWYVRRQIRRLQVLPVRMEAEARAAVSLP